MGEQLPSRWLYKHTLHGEEVDIRKHVPWFLHPDLGDMTDSSYLVTFR